MQKLSHRGRESSCCVFKRLLVRKHAALLAGRRCRFMRPPAQWTFITSKRWRIAYLLKPRYQAMIEPTLNRYCLCENKADALRRPSHQDTGEGCVCMFACVCAKAPPPLHPSLPVSTATAAARDFAFLAIFAARGGRITFSTRAPGTSARATSLIARVSKKMYYYYYYYNFILPWVCMATKTEMRDDREEDFCALVLGVWSTRWRDVEARATVRPLQVQKWRSAAHAGCTHLDVYRDKSLSPMHFYFFFKKKKIRARCKACPKCSRKSEERKSLIILGNNLITPDFICCALKFALHSGRCVKV